MCIYTNLDAVLCVLAPEWSVWEREVTSSTPATFRCGEYFGKSSWVLRASEGRTVMLRDGRGATTAVLYGGESATVVGTKSRQRWSRLEVAMRTALKPQPWGGPIYFRGLVQQPRAAQWRFLFHELRSDCLSHTEAKKSSRVKDPIHVHSISNDA